MGGSVSQSASIVQSVRIHSSVFKGTYADTAAFTQACKLFMTFNTKDSTFPRPISFTVLIKSRFHLVIEGNRVWWQTSTQPVYLVILGGFSAR